MLVSRISNYVPTVKIVAPEQMLKNLSKIAVPAICLVGASMITGSTATPFGDCIEADLTPEK